MQFRSQPTALGSANHLDGDCRGEVRASQRIPIITGVMLRYCVCDDTLASAISPVMKQSGFISQRQSVSTPRTKGCVFQQGESER